MQLSIIHQKTKPESESIPRPKLPAVHVTGHYLTASKKFHRLKAKARNSSFNFNISKEGYRDIPR